MADNIRQGLNQRKRADSGEQELRENINFAASKAMQKFIQRLETGEIPIDNMADFIRVLGAYKEINNIDGVLEGSNISGALPEISMTQNKVIEDRVGESAKGDDGEERFDIADLSMEDMTKLIENIDKEQNKENERGF